MVTLTGALARNRDAAILKQAAQILADGVDAQEGERLFSGSEPILIDGVLHTLTLAPVFGEITLMDWAAYVHGRNSRMTRTLAVEENPYPPETLPRQYWEAGWMEADMALAYSAIASTYEEVFNTEEGDTDGDEYEDRVG